ncbi:Mov34/MPN/PAD-1 family protein [Rhodococcus sp. IEGM1428]|uniref:Mov34/MPN/PAD-1 family protein n=1 Tax=Rhodococcus sp. IEGM1428 TaxID=3392191 RepID=UPI003D112407
MTAPRRPQLSLTQQAHNALRAHARASRRCEYGGVLVGYRTQNGLHIEDALLVPDHTAARTHYLRRGRDATTVLAEYLDLQSDPVIGYVGEWHTHPAPAPPSAIDHAAMRLMSSKNKRPVALVVAALELNHRDIQLYAMLSTPSSLPRRLLGRYHDVLLDVASL